jgi:hypothetical protein
MANTTIPIELSSTPGIVDNSNTTAITIDSSENVGIGVTPSSWSSSVYKGLQIGTGIGVGGIIGRVDGTNSINLGVNWYYGGGATNTYIDSAAATNYSQEAGTHRWFHAASGTAGGALTFSESMRIDSSGNLLVGTTDPTPYDRTSGNAIALGDGLISSAQEGGNAAIFNRMTNDGSIVQFRKDGTAVGSIGTNGGDLFFADGSYGGIKPLGDAYAIVPSTSSGVDYDNAMSLGTSSVRFKNLHLSSDVYLGDWVRFGGATNYYVHSDNNNYLRFGTAGSERVRIDSSGSLLVGTTTTGPGAQSGVAIAGGATSSDVYIRHANGTASGAVYAAFIYNTSQIGSITQNGNSQVLYNISSDQRLKENIADADDAGSKVDAIQVRKFDWKADGSHQDYGMVAQELIEVAPEARGKKNGNII